MDKFGKDFKADLHTGMWDSFKFLGWIVAMVFGLLLIWR